MKYFKVLHDFQATDAVELSVRKGDVLCASERVEQDGWLKVEMAADTRRRGFVPVTYVKECPAPPSSYGLAPSAATAPPAGGTFTNAALNFGEKSLGGNSQAPSSSIQAAYAPPATSRSSSQAYPSQHHSGHGAADFGTPMVDRHHGGPSSQQQAGQGAPQGGSGGFLLNPNAVVEAFMKNEVYFKQLMKSRQEALSKLENGISEAAADVAACKDKNAILARKLRDLDQTIEKERRKWKERVDEEKLLLQRAVATSNVPPLSTSGPGVTTVTTHVTSTNSTRSLSQNHAPRSSLGR